MLSAELDAVDLLSSAIFANPLSVSSGNQLYMTMQDAGTSGILSRDPHPWNHNEFRFCKLGKSLSVNCLMELQPRETNQDMRYVTQHYLLDFM